ncbi:MAG: hypothetical protein C5B55_12690 [Blastocatellia bacterium]|nr:MAG: hypothetical protein C5B55_12690 [Blastocatellia bacterium]
MRNPKGLSVICLLLVLLTAHTVSAQSSAGDASKPNLEVQLHLLVASNEPGEGRLPTTLEPIVKQLRSTLQLTNYRLTATFANSVKNGNSLESKGVLPSDAFAQGPSGPVFYEFTLQRITASEAPNSSIDISQLRFGLRVPIIMSTGTPPALANINYEPTGVTTSLTLREATPTVFGTLSMNKPNQLLVLVISVKRTS